jgi:hypothetical protein
MGLKELLGKLMKGGGSDDEPYAGEAEDYEGRKADTRAGESLAGAEAIETARDELDDRA